MARDLDSSLLRTFVTVVELGSVSGAAQRLSRTQAAVSMAIKRLEDDVGQRLLERSPRGMAPTDAGHALLPYAHRILGAAAEARRQLAGRHVEGQVRLGMFEDVATGRLPHALRRFASVYQRVAVDLSVDRSRALAEGFQAGRFDLVIGDRATFGAAATPVVAWSLPLFWVGARAFELDAGQPVPLVVFDGPCVWQQGAFSALSAAGVPWRVVCTSTSLLAILSAVDAGLGLAVLLGDTIRASTMRVVGAAEGLVPLPHASFGLYAAEAAASSAAVTALRGFLTEELASSVVGSSRLPGDGRTPSRTRARRRSVSGRDARAASLSSSA